MTKKRDETPIQKKILEYLRSLPNTTAFKVSGGLYQVSGISDIIGCRNGKFIAIEVKHPNNPIKGTPLQLAFGEKVKKSGGFFMVANSVEEVKGAIF